jgi:hypothetical protein
MSRTFKDTRRGKRTGRFGTYSKRNALTNPKDREDNREWHDSKVTFQGRAVTHRG